MRYIEIICQFCIRDDKNTGKYNFTYNARYKLSVSYKNILLSFFMFYKIRVYIYNNFYFFN